ncbi:ATP-binding protein [Methylomonas albis]|uniref:histidine kinase n=1 Tax=Methylomonas albis TaxID=1854563 RepID=A0ABR9D6B0_9GAMM|nr:ATP-binding protein [Methylomonas albis]MBD9358316.1 ATP-binding protein [Methylomonas albis]
MAKFKTRARAVDMLGRQQIANVSTAISELFKNAHDAYADHAEVDYFRSDNLLVIRDDGIGMTKADFENRWLVLGTESKYTAQNRSIDTYRPSGKAERAVMGEKGIGRLAIGLLGEQVLVLTRAQRADGLHDLVMCFIHWGLFEIPVINLDEIEIPIRVIREDKLPSNIEVGSLVQEFKKNIELLERRNIDYDFGHIVKDLDDFQVDPENLQSFLSGISLAESSGTHFYIAPANHTILAEIELDKSNNKKDFSKYLLGFCNSVFLENTSPPIKASFRYWPSDSDNDDLLSDGEFFTVNELNNADHRVFGEIDHYGQFRGSIRIYENVTEDYIIPWKESGGKLTDCGPFDIELGFVHGNQRESRLDPADWKRLSDKLNLIGGIYVYRDRIRILPYGNPDVDWLEIELRRTKSASYYVFSHRLIFGAVKLSRQNNSSLKEKAGREGFQQDKAYRQLKNILMNIFNQLAADFFREGGERAEYFDARKKELEKLELARRKREKQVSTKRKNLSASLDGFFQRTQQGIPNLEIESIRSHVKHRMDSAAKITDPDEAAVALLDAEKEANRRLSELQESYRIARPRGVGLSRQLQRDWEAYSTETQRLESEIFRPFSEEITRQLGNVATQARIYIDQRKRLQSLIKELADSEKKSVRNEAGKLNNTAEDTRKAATKVARDAIHELQNTISKVEAEFASKDFNGLSPEQTEQVRKDFETRIETVSKKNTESLSRIRDVLTSVAENMTTDPDITQIDMMEAMDEELETLREQVDTDADLVQLGLAVAVINHEFEAAIKGVRRSLRELRPWADLNSNLAPLYQEIRNNFDHLDGHLNLFTPLQRRLYRKPIEIKGSDILHYVKTLFDVRLKRHDVKLSATENFTDMVAHGFPSTLYPVFVNIIDNAIFWLKDMQGEKQIKLDSDGKSFFISNTGPGIHARDYESVFEQGFSRKPGGRGLGLFISRKALRKEGMDINIVPSDSPAGVTFKLTWKDE